MDNSQAIINVSIDNIVPNKYQPRKYFEEKSLTELAKSIETYGIINPILVRKKEDKYEIIAGERRFRAAKLCNLTEVPVIIKNADEQQMAELALIENLERQELTAIETAQAYEEIIKMGNHTQSQLATKLGKSQAAIANKIRLLSLPLEIQEALMNRKISERHARSLLSLNDKEKQISILNRIIDDKLTVKETEELISLQNITEADVKQAINDIMKSLNIKEEEKEDENMNNGNFFPNYDNNMGQPNNISLNSLNSMNQMPQEQENVMPTGMMEPQMAPNMPNFNIGPSAPMEQNAPMAPAGEELLFTQPMNQPPVMEEPVQPMQPIDTPLFNQNMQTVEPIAPSNNDDQPMNFGISDQNAGFNQQLETPIINPIPNLFEQNTNMGPNIPNFNVGPSAPMEQNAPMAPAGEELLFTQPMNQPPVMEQNPPVIAPTMEEPPVNETFYEVPVNISPVIETTSQNGDKFTEVKQLLSSNGIAYKAYSNENSHCIIIEL